MPQLIKETQVTCIFMIHNSCFIIIDWYLGMTEDQHQIQELAHKFATEEIIPNAPYHDRTGEFPHEILKKGWELGLTNNHIPASVGEDAHSYTCIYFVLLLSHMIVH